MALKTSSSSKKTAKKKDIKLMQKPTPKFRRFNVDIPEELHRKVKMKAIGEGLKLNELAVKLFNEYLSK